MQKLRHTLLPLPVAASLLAMGCVVVGPNYEPPKLDAPDKFIETAGDPDISIDAGTTGTAVVDHSEWWKNFNDPVLNSLIDQALTANDDLQIAWANLREARAQAGAARTEWLPNASLGAGHTYSRTSLTGPEADAAGVGSTLDKNDFDRETDFFDAGFDATWEADLWGRVSRSVEAADAETVARIEDIRDIQVVLLGELATNYLLLRQSKVRLGLNEALLESQRETLKLTHTLNDQGVGTQLEVERGEALAESTAAILPALRIEVATYASRIAVLTGLTLEQVYERVEDDPESFDLPGEIAAVGIPADLLRNRPDLRRAEARLRAAVARIGVATANLYPRFTISGSLGWSAVSLGDLNASDSLGAGFGPRISWAFLDIPEVKQRILAADANADAARITYQKYLRMAVADVETAIAGWREERALCDRLEKSAQHYRNAVALSRELYNAGAESYFNVLEVERLLLETENRLAVSRADRAVRLVAVYKALGGGWSAQADVVPPTPEQSTEISNQTAAQAASQTEAMPATPQTEI